MIRRVYMKLGLYYIQKGMFESSHPSTEHQTREPLLLRKKRMYQQQIRKKDRKNLINQLRRNAELPDDLTRLIQSFPANAIQFINKLQSEDTTGWQEAIAYILLNNKRDDLKQLFQMKSLTWEHFMGVFLFLIIYGNEEVSFYNQFYEFILKKSEKCSRQETPKMLNIYTVMMKKGQSYILQDAEQFISKTESNRFYTPHLKFYNTILKTNPTQHNINFFLPRHILMRLSRQIDRFHYVDEERIMMIEILIQVLYQSEQEEISKSFDLEIIFKNLEYFFAFANKNKMLLDRSILLTYNINIDATSFVFVRNNCFKVITFQMKKKDNPNKIRSLMAQLYLNSIYCYPSQKFYEYIVSNRVEIFNNFEFIIDEFGHCSEIKEMSIQLFRTMLSVSTQEKNLHEEDFIINHIKGHPTFLKTLEKIKQSGVVLEEYQIMKTSQTL